MDEKNQSMIAALSIPIEESDIQSSTIPKFPLTLLSQLQPPVKVPIPSSVVHIDEEEVPTVDTQIESVEGTIINAPST